MDSNDRPVNSLKRSIDDCGLPPTKKMDSTEHPLNSLERRIDNDFDSKTAQKIKKVSLQFSSNGRMSKERIKARPSTINPSVRKSGVDEAVSIELMKELGEGMTLDERFLCSLTRYPIKWLVFVNPDGSGLTGHTPALKSSKTKGNEDSISGASGKANDKRKDAVRLSINDPERKAADASIVAQLKTIQYFQSPQTLFEAEREKTQKREKPIFSVDYPDSDLRDKPTYAMLTKQVSDKREDYKWSTAQFMADNGYIDLVPVQYRQTLNENPNVSGKELRIKHIEMTGNDYEWNSSLSSSADSSLDGNSLANVRKQKPFARPLSPPRQTLGKF